MKNRKFLVPLAALVAGFAAGESQASIQTTSIVPQVDVTKTAGAIRSDRILVNNGDDQFSFVLRRMEDGQMVAAHESHYSHRSHSSHRSHYSGG